MSSVPVALSSPDGGALVVAEDPAGADFVVVMLTFSRVFGTRHAVASHVTRNLSAPEHEPTGGSAIFNRSRPRPRELSAASSIRSGAGARRSAERPDARRAGAW